MMIILRTKTKKLRKEEGGEGKVNLRQAYPAWAKAPNQDQVSTSLKTFLFQFYFFFLT